MKLFIAAPDIFTRDAVGNHCLALARVAGRAGIEVEMYAQRYGVDTGVVESIDKLFSRARLDDILLVSYSIYDPLLDMLLDLPCRKICYFHGVTPPELLREYEPETADLCERSFEQFNRLASFDRVLANSKMTARTIASYVSMDQIQIVPPVTADMPFFHYISKRNSVTPMSTNFIVVGRVVPHKRIDDAIRIVAQLRQDHIAANLRVVGNAPNRYYNESLRTLMCALGVEEHVVFNGLVDEAELFDVFDHAGALLSVSQHEGFCVPVLEAMHIGLPVFSRAGTAAGEIGADAIAEFDSVEAACTIMREVLIDPVRQRAMVNAGKKQAAALLRAADNRILTNIIRASAYAEE